MDEKTNIETIRNISNMTLEALGRQPKGLYWLALQNSISATPINIKSVLELTPGELFRGQKDIRRPLARVRKPIYATWQRRGRPIARYGNVKPR